MQVGASKGEQATLKMIQSGYCVACAAGKFPLAPLTFAIIFLAPPMLTVCHAMLAPAAPTFQDAFQARWIFDGTDTAVPKVLVGCVSIRKRSKVVSKL